MFNQYDNFKTEEPYYNGEKLLNMLDLDGERPEIYISTSNRSAGKTTFFNGSAVHDFIQNGNKFTILYRNKYETESAAESFFKEIGKIFFPRLTMIQETLVKNVCYRLLIGESVDIDDSDAAFCGVCCGYVISLSAAEQIKRCSHLMSDSTKIIFDEFQSEKGAYLKNEISLLMSIHDSLARGDGQQAKYLPLYLIGNLIDIYNPYYESLGITQRLTPECNYMRGNGWVLEQGFNAAASESHEKSAFHKAFASESYTATSKAKEYLIKDSQFIDKTIPNRGLYIATIRFNSINYGIRYIEEYNIYYISVKIEPSKKMQFAATENDICATATYFRKHTLKDHMREALHNGRLWFDCRKSQTAGLAFIYGRA